MKIFLITGVAGKDGLGEMLCDAILANDENNRVISIREKSLPMVDGPVSSRIHNFYCDLSSESSILDACNSIKSVCLHVDVFIHAAGVSSLNWIDKIPVGETQRAMMINAISPTIFVKELMSHLDGSSVCCISSNASHMPMRCSLSYNMSKAALTMAVKQMARELTLAHDMTIFSVSPNRLKGTRMSKTVDASITQIRRWSKKQVEDAQDSAMMNGEQTDPAKLVEFLLFLLSDKENHKMMSGSDIPYGV